MALLHNTLTPVSYTHLDVYKRQVVTYGQLYEDEQSALEDWQGPLSAFEEQDWRDIPALYIPQENEMFCQFYTVAAVLVFSLALAAGLLGALWRRLGLGRGFWGRLPLEWHVFVGFCMLVCCMDGAGHIVWAARDGTFADVAHTLFFLDADDSMLLGKAVAAGLLLSLIHISPRWVRCKATR